MILIVTHRRGFEADFVIDILRNNNVAFMRFNQDEYPDNMLATTWYKDIQFGGVLRKGSKTLYIDDIKVAWCHQTRKPVLDEYIDADARQIAETETDAFLTGLWQSTPWSWVNHPTAITTASNKLYQLQVAQQLGFSIPDTLVTNNLEEALAFIDSYDQVIMKDLATQTLSIGKQRYVSYTRRITRDEIVAKGMRGGIPICLQQYILKHKEIRATVVGEKVFSVAIDSQADRETLDDYRRGRLAVGERYVATVLPAPVEALCVELVKLLGLDYGAIDFILTPAGSYVFLEINTTGAWIWAEKLTGLPISEAIVDLLIERLNMPVVA